MDRRRHSVLGESHQDEPLTDKTNSAGATGAGVMGDISVSSFHQRLKAVTWMSPVQFQKALRLQEARRLLLSTMVDARTANWRVG